MKIIGITGLAGAGKDTVAAALVEHVNGCLHKAIRQGFADALKLSAARLFKPDIELPEAIEFCDNIKLNCGILLDEAPGGRGSYISGRRFLQRYGTEAHRDVFGADFWLDAVLPTREVTTSGDHWEIECTRNDCELLVIPDVRFENEARRVKACGGELWEIGRPGLKPVEAHASESGVPAALIDKTILNAGTIDELRADVVRLLPDELTEVPWGGIDE